MKKFGAQPTRIDHRDFDFHRTFGTTIVALPPEYNCDAGLTMPNQDLPNPMFNISALPFGCTDYTTTELCGDEDKVAYNPGYTESKTLANASQGGDIRKSLNSSIVWGVQTSTETTDAQAATHRRGQYFNVQATIDYFDGIRSTLWANQANKRSVSIGTPWFPNWEQTNNGIISAPFSYDATGLGWHNWKICGWKTINGVVYLVGKTWQGPDYGDNGWAYFPRDVINAVMAIKGSAAFTLAQATPGSVINIQVTMIQWLISLFSQLKEVLYPA